MMTITYPDNFKTKIIQKLKAHATLGARIIAEEINKIEGTEGRSLNDADKLFSVVAEVKIARLVLGLLENENDSLERIHQRLTQVLLDRPGHSSSVTSNLMKRFEQDAIATILSDFYWAANSVQADK